MRRLIVFTILLTCLLTPLLQAQTPKSIRIKYSELTKLLEAANRQQDPLPEKPPLAYALTKATYEGVLQEKVVDLDIDYECQVYASGWVLIQLVGANHASIAEITWDGQPAAVVTHHNFIQVAVKDAIGKHRLRMKIQTDVQQLAIGNPSIQLTIPIVPIASLTFTTSPDIKNVKLQSLRLPGENQVYRADLSGNHQLQLNWTVQTKESEHIEASEDTLTEFIYADVHSVCQVQEKAAILTTTINYTTPNPVPDRTLSVFLPSTVKVLDVEGSQVKNWTQVETDTTLIVQAMQTPGKWQSTSLTIKYETLYTDTFAIANLRVEDVYRQKGWLALSAENGIQTNLVSLTGNITLIDPSELPFGGSYLWAFRYLNDAPYQINLHVKQYPIIPVLEAIVDESDIVTYVDEGGQTITQATYLVRNNQQQYLHLQLPDSSDVWTTLVNNKAVKPAGNNSNEVLIPLDATDDVSYFPVEIVYVSKVPPLKRWGELKTSLPKIDIPIAQMRWWVYLPEEYRFTQWGGTVHHTVDFASRRQYAVEETPASGKKMPTNVDMEIANKVEDVGGFDKAAPPPVPKPNAAKQVPNIPASPARDNFIVDDLPEEYQPQIEEKNLFAEEPAPPPEITVESKEDIAHDEFRDEGGITGGELPVKVSVPTEGVIYRFERLFVLDETPYFTASYAKPIKLPYLVVILIIFLIYGLIVFYPFYTSIIKPRLEKKVA